MLTELYEYIASKTNRVKLFVHARKIPAAILILKRALRIQPSLANLTTGLPRSGKSQGKIKHLQGQGKVRENLRSL